MIVLRIADYFQFDAERVSPISLKLKTFESPISLVEHSKHLSIKFVKESSKDDELLIIEANPLDVKMFLDLIKLFQSIQYEIDISWAIIGEIYGRLNKEKRPSIKYRRLKSNLDSNSYNKNQFKYVPELIEFTADKEVLKLLIGPLYGYNPTYGIRELLQNSIDACWEREKLELDNIEPYKPKVQLILGTENKQPYFQIIDNGRGMTLFEIKNYFLKAGISYRENLEWRKNYQDYNNIPLIHRNGRFGIGVLAAFLLGNQITGCTKSMKEDAGYIFHAKIDDTNIEVEKEDNLTTGTSIKISLNQNIYKLLFENVKVRLNNLKEEKNTYLYRWDKWFTLKNPEVSIIIEDYKPIKPFENPDPGYYDFLPEQWNSFSTTDFKKVLWTYSDGYSCIKLACNGIAIPHSFILKDQLIKVNPYLSVFDFNGTFNLSLNRNSLIGKVLPFEKKLLTEIYTDILKKILTHDLNCIYDKGEIIFSRDELFTHKAIGTFNVIYMPSGFLIDIPIIKKNMVSEILNLNFIGDLEKPIKFTVKNSVVIKIVEHSLELLLEDKSIEVNTNPKAKNIPGYLSLKQDKIDDLKTQYYLLNDYLIFDPKSHFLKNKITYSTEHVFKSTKYDGGELLFKLMKMYLGRSLIIPYNIEERKRKFLKAFKKLNL
jgi:molecular chaperone HtpG